MKENYYFVHLNPSSAGYILNGNANAFKLTLYKHLSFLPYSIKMEVGFMVFIIFITRSCKP